MSKIRVEIQEAQAAFSRKQEAKGEGQ